jgi:hypothetical protein
MLQKWRDRLKVPAIHDHDLETILKDLGILDKIASGQILCSVCGTPLTLDSIECLYLQDNELKFCCNKIQCCELVLNITQSRDHE